MRHLLSNWPEIIERLKSARTFLLFADYDGTLTPIVDRPEDAILSDEMRRSLRLLSILPNFTVGVISGRSLKDTINRVGLISVVYAGNHGMEIKELSGITEVDPEILKTKPLIDDLHRKLVSNLRQIPGAIIEHKERTLSIHYRLVSENMMQKLRTLFDDTVGDAVKAGTVRITHGKKVFEVRPAVDINKGTTLRNLIDKYKRGNSIDSTTLLPIYIGDDLTDEDGFHAVEEYGNGLSVFVGAPQTQSAARYYLHSTAEVNEFLKMLHHQIESRFAM